MGGAMNNHFYACIMAGGTGTRFWPQSTIKKPKQLLCIGTEKPLLNMTLERVRPLIPFDRQIIVTGDDISQAVADAAPEIPLENIISEPLRKNTAPCIYLAAKIIQKRDPDAVICVLPSDHIIQRDKEFLSILSNAADLAATKDVLITLGITARYPETGYGYIEFGPKKGTIHGRDYYSVASFREKPKRKIAKEYIKQGNFSWNSGMFVWSVKSIISSIKRHMPKIYEAFDGIDKISDPKKLKEAIDTIYPKIQGISIDYGLMEKADNIVGFPADIGWNDVGSWTSLKSLVKPDEQGNYSQGQFIAIDSKDCITASQNGIIVAIGVEDLIIVQTEKATLICDKNRAQDIKKVFSELEKRKLRDFM